jgi:hypothetical protein
MSHEEKMREWRHRNDGGDCGRVANELLDYIDEIQADRDYVAEKLLHAVWLYSGYEVRSRGPYGLLLDAIERARPDVGEAMRQCQNFSEDMGEVRRRFFPTDDDEVPCVRCGKQVEPARRCYVIPHCNACLAPPEPLKTFTIPDEPKGKLPSERIDEIETALRDRGATCDFTTRYLTALAMFLDEHIAGKVPVPLDPLYRGRSP